MKRTLLDILACPVCLPEEKGLIAQIEELQGDDIVTGRLRCSSCAGDFPIRQGIAVLDPAHPSRRSFEGNKYETPPVVSSYLWSHYCDLLKEENASEAYQVWAGLMTPHDGICIDAGCAVGRHAFEMTKKSDFVIGLDTSRAFVQAARELMLHRRMDITLKEEGHLTRTVEFVLPAEWPSHKAEFIVADALALPLKANTASSISSLNLIDKVPMPMKHLMEADRVTRRKSAQFLISDPFSWSEEAAPEGNWLGGQKEGSYTSRGHEHLLRILAGEGGLLQPGWTIETEGRVWWKIRTHANHFEQIRSCYLKAVR
jgi:uncharacterized protein YbaR (Trm112 family)